MLVFDIGRRPPISANGWTLSTMTFSCPVDHPGKFGKAASARIHEKMAIADLGAPRKDISISGPAGKSAAAREEMDNAVQEPAVRPNQVRMLRLGLHRWRQRQARLVADVLTDERNRPLRQPAHGAADDDGRYRPEGH